MPLDAFSKRPGQPATSGKASGATNYHAGQSAELRVIADYEARGYRMLQHRWRGKAGEVDLIFAGSDEIIFVEVKKSRSFERALASLGQKQISRLMRAAEEYLGSLTQGALTPMRFDVVAMNDFGDVQVVENALMA